MGAVIERVLLLLIIIHISRIRAAPLQCSDFANDIVVTKSPVPGNVTLAITQTINGSDAFDYLCYCIAFPVGNRLISLADITGLNVTNANLTVDELPPISSLQCLTSLNLLSLQGQFLPNGPPSNWIASFGNLAVLDLSYSHMQYLDIDVLAMLTKLTTLDLRANAFALLPNDLFVNNPKLNQLYLDNNFILDPLPLGIFTNTTSLSLVSHYNTPRLSCLPPVSFTSPFSPGSLPVCSVMSSFTSVKLSGSSISCRQLRLSYLQGWVTESDLPEIIIDLSMMSRIDSSRFVNPAVIHHGMMTSLVVDILPAWRQGQVEAKSLVYLIKNQLLDPNSILMSGVITKQLTTSSVVADVPVIRRFCKITGLYQADAAVCPTAGATLSGLLPSWAYPAAAVAIGILVGLFLRFCCMRCRSRSPESRSLALGNGSTLQQMTMKGSSVLVPVVQPIQGLSPKAGLHSSLPVVYCNTHQYYSN